MKHIHLRYDENDFKTLKKIKVNLAKKVNMSLSWEEFVFYVITEARKK